MGALGGVAASCERGTPVPHELHTVARICEILYTSDHRNLGKVTEREFFTDNLLVRVHHID